MTRANAGADSREDARLQFRLAEVGHHHPDRHDRGERVGDALARDVGCGTMNRLEQADTIRVDVPRSSQAHATTDDGSDVGDDVPEQVRGHNHLEVPRVLHDLGAEDVDELVADLDLREQRRDLLDDPMPQPARLGHGVRLGREAQLGQSVAARVLEGGEHDAGSPAVRGRTDLLGDLVWRAFVHDVAAAGVAVLDVLTEDDESRTVAQLVLEWGARRIHHQQGALVDVEIETEAGAKQQVAGVLVAGHARITNRTHVDAVEAVAPVGHHLCGEGGAVAQEAVGAEVVVHDLDLVGRHQRGECQPRDRTDFRADSVCIDPTHTEGRREFHLMF